MTEIVTDKTLDEYEAFIASHPKGHFMQSSLWAKQKPDWNWVAIVKRDESGKIIGSLSMLVRKVPGIPYTLMYCCRGPVCDLDDYDTILDLIEGAKTLAKSFRSYCIKLDPDILSHRADIRDLLLSVGFRLLDSAKNFEGIQPRYVFRLDVEGKTEEEMLMFFSSKTRYNIRLAMRKGVEVKLVNEEGLDDFSELMIETGIRDNFVTRPKSYFANMLKNLGEHARLYMAYYEGIPIAGTLAIRFGDKVWYLYGASSNNYRNLMPNYLLQWNMIKWALDEGCKIYDFRGVSGDLSEDNPLYGLYRFKRGFNGDFCEFLGEFDYVVNPVIYSAVDIGRKAMNYIVKKRYQWKNRDKVENKPPRKSESE
ncbi:MAG: lipid II:glycine glycyltransferase FemX [Eubacteriales bacterium]|jgi:peptidoglycan pentaglycine glycine transferase (the first glycine)